MSLLSNLAKAVGTAAGGPLAGVIAEQIEEAIEERLEERNLPVNLTPHFTLDELTITEHREFDNTPNEAELENLKRLADFLEQVKVVLGGKPIMVNSAFRCKQVNDAVGSKDTSQHRIGCAADIRVPGMTPDQVVKAIIASGIGYDQVIREFDRWTHVSIPNTVADHARRQALIIDRQGTRAFA